MALYEVSGPTGQIYHIEGPDNADPSTVIQQVTGSAAPKPAPAPTSAPPTIPTASQHAADALGVIRQHPFTTGIGLLENGLSGATGGFGSLADALTLSQPGTHDWAYRPRSEAGQQIASLGAQEGAQVGQMYDRTFGTGPLAATIKEFAPEAMGAVGTVAGLAGVPKGIGAARSAFTPRPLPSAQAVVDGLAARSPQSMGAAFAAPSMANVSPELQNAIARSGQKAGSVNPEVLNRHLEADSLPVRMQLTAGQATQDPAAISNEQNLRARFPQLVDRYQEQNRQLVQNVQAIRDSVGPDVFTTNATEHGDTLIDAYKSKDAAAQQGIKAKYQALRDANGGQFPVDAQRLLDNASAQLHQQLLFDHAPKGIMGSLNRLADNGSMTFENFESLRTNLARIQRSPTADGNEKAAAGVIRNAMEQLPLQEGAAKLKPLADAARAAAKTQFDALEADPAYKAAVRGTVPPDRFVSRFVINAPRGDLAVMRQNLNANPTAAQTLGVAALDHLRSAAGIDPDWNGNFAAGRFNKTLQALSPKLRSLVDARTADQLETLGNVARYTQAQPRGSFVNSSNTLTAALGSHATSALEGAVNFHAHGLPVGTVGRKIGQHLLSGRFLKQATAPGAGLNYPVRNVQPQVTSGLMGTRPGGLMGNP